MHDVAWLKGKARLDFSKGLMTGMFTENGDCSRVDRALQLLPGAPSVTVHEEPVQADSRLIRSDGMGDPVFRPGDFLRGVTH